MKTFTVLSLSALFCGCFPGREIQAEMTYATLVKVEEVNRYPNNKGKILTWQTDKDVSFVTFEPLATQTPLGTRTKVLVHR